MHSEVLVFDDKIDVRCSSSLFCSGDLDVQNYRLDVLSRRCSMPRASVKHIFSIPLWLALFGSKPMYLEMPGSKVQQNMIDL